MFPMLSILLVWTFHNSGVDVDDDAPGRLFMPNWTSRAEHQMQPLFMTFRYDDTQYSSGNRTTHEKVINKCSMSGLIALGGRGNATDDFIYFLTPLIMLQSSSSCGGRTSKNVTAATVATPSSTNKTNTTTTTTTATTTKSQAKSSAKFNQVPCYMYEVKPGTGRSSAIEKVDKPSFPKSLLGHTMEPVEGGFFGGASEFTLAKVTLDGAPLSDGAQIVMPATHVNETSPPRSIVISNVADTSVYIRYMIDGDDATSFRVSPAIHEATVAAGGATTVQLTFHPYMTRQLNWLGTVLYIYTSDAKKPFRVYLYGIGLDNVSGMSSNATATWNEGVFRARLLSYSTTVPANVSHVSVSAQMARGSTSVIKVDGKPMADPTKPVVVALEPAPLATPVYKECTDENCTTDYKHATSKKKYTIVQVTFKQTKRVVVSIKGLSMDANGGALQRLLRDNGNDPANLNATTLNTTLMAKPAEYTFTFTHPVAPMTYAAYKAKYPATAEAAIADIMNATLNGTAVSSTAFLQLRSNIVAAPPRRPRRRRRHRREVVIEHLEDTSVEFEAAAPPPPIDASPPPLEHLAYSFKAKSEYAHQQRSEDERSSESKIASFVVFGGITHGAAVGKLVTNDLWYLHVHPPTILGTEVIGSTSVDILGKLPTASGLTKKNGTKYAFHVRWERVLIKSGPTPPARHGHVSKNTGPLIVVWSGAGVKGLRNDLWVYDSRFRGASGATGCGCPGPWKQVVPLGKIPPARHHAASALLTLSNGKMYLVAYGGMGLEGMLQDAVLLELGGCRQGIHGCPIASQLRFTWYHIRTPVGVPTSHAPGPMVNHMGFQSSTAANTFIIVGGYGYEQPLDYSLIHHMDENRQIENIVQYKIHLASGDIWHNERLKSTYTSTPKSPKPKILPGNQMHKLTCTVASDTGRISCAWRKGTIGAKLLYGNGTWSQGRIHAAVTRLRDGRVLVSGGMPNTITTIFWNRYTRFPCEQQRRFKPLTAQCYIDFYKQDMERSKKTRLDPIKYPYKMFHDAMFVVTT